MGETSGVGAVEVVVVEVAVEVALEVASRRPGEIVRT